MPAWETGGVGTSRVASVRRPGWVSDAPRVASKVVISVHTRTHALVWTRETIVLCEARPRARGLYSHPRVHMRGFQGVIVTRVCTCVCRVPCVVLVVRRLKRSQRLARRRAAAKMSQRLARQDSPPGSSRPGNPRASPPVSGRMLTTSLTHSPGAKIPSEMLSMQLRRTRARRCRPWR